MADLATEEQRFDIVDLFAHFGIRDVNQVHADAARILKLDYLPDLRELTRDDAAELIDELRRAVARERMSDE